MAAGASEKPVLHVWGVEADNLAAKDRGNTSDPYAILRLGAQSFQTEVQKTTLDPVWEKNDFRFDGDKTSLASLSPTETKLEVEVWDQNVFTRHELIGRVTVVFEELMENPTRAIGRWFTLTADGTETGEIAGQIRMNLQVLNFRGRPKPKPVAAAVAAGGAGAGAPGSSASTALVPAGSASASGAGAASAASSAAAVAVAMGSGAEESKDAGDGDGDVEEMVPNQLRLTIHQARSLPRSGGLDSLVKIVSRGKEAKTTVHPKSADPIWRETFLVPAPNSSSSFELRVESSGMLRNELLGQVTVYTRAFNKRGTHLWLKLCNRKNEPQDGLGEVEVEGTLEYAEHPVKRPEPARDGGGRGAAGGGGAGGSGDSADGAGAESGDVVEEDEKEKKTMSEEERAKRAAEEAKKRAELESVEFKDGDYQIQVHVIEVRNLHPEDPNGSADPMVEVVVMGKRQYTKKFSKRTSAVFDQVLFFNFKDLPREQIEEAVITLNVWDTDIFQNDLIGLYQFDASYVYFRPHHEVHNQWVAISDPTSKDDNGLQGYLKCSVTVLGPGDKKHIYDAVEEAKQAALEEEQGLDSLLLMPPQIERKTEFLVIRCYEAEEMTALDDARLGGLLSQAGIDAFVEVKFAGNLPARTPWKTIKGKSGTLQVRWDRDNELWLPVLTPTMTDRITVHVWDHDQLKTNDLLGTFYLRYSELKKDPMAPKWFPVYGCPEGIEFGAEKDKMNMFPELASAYRGRVLLSAEVIDEPEEHEEEITHRKTASALDERFFPRLAAYQLRALVITGAEIPRFKKNLLVNTGLKSSDVGIEISIGRYSFKTKMARNRKGIADWCELLGNEKDILLPEDPDQLPDTFVYLFRGSPDKPERVCYARFSSTELFRKGFGIGPDGTTIAQPEWVALKADTALDALTSEEQPGAVLMRLGFGMASAPVGDWEEELSKVAERNPYEVRLHVYQGRNLPAADDNGSLDPYVRAVLVGESQETDRRDCTTSPMWYTTLSLDVELPALKYAPQLLVQLWDWDRFSSDDFVSDCRLSLLDPRVIHCTWASDGSMPLPDPLPDPVWYPLGALDRTGAQGELLLNVQVIRKDSRGTEVPPIPRSIRPICDDWYVEVIALGLRSLAPYMFQQIQYPCVEFDVGDRSRSSKVKQTSHSKRPSGSDPNFCERILIPVQLPRNPLFAPCLNLIVRDQRLGGFSNPVVGTASVSLDTKIPGTPIYQPPRGSTISAQSTTTVEEDDSADGAAGGSSAAMGKKVDAPLLARAGLTVATIPSGGDASEVSGGASLPAASSTPLPVEPLVEDDDEEMAGEEATTATEGASESPAESTSSLPTDAVVVNVLEPSSAVAGGTGATTAAAAAAGSLATQTAAGAILNPFVVKLEAPKKPLNREAMLAAFEDLEAGMGGAAGGSEGDAESETVSLDGGDSRGKKRRARRGGDRRSSLDSSSDEFVRVDGGLHDADDLSFLTRNLRYADGADSLDPEDDAVKYMRGRRIYTTGLEDVFETAPFETYPIMRGQVVGRGSVFGIPLPSSLKRVGYFKGIIRVIRDPDEEIPISMEGLMKPADYCVRIYALDARGVQPMDDTGTSDCYLKFKLGNKTLDDRKHYIPETTDPAFYRCYELTTKLPGPSRLEVSMWDYDMITSDDFIGKTVIDLEDRWFEPRWQALGMSFEEPDRRFRPKPIEERELWSPTSSTSQGSLRLWVDVMTPEQSKRYPPVNIAPPAPEKFEVRVIVWRTRGVKSADAMTDQNDLYIQGWIEGQKPQSTDIHWRCKNGKGSFNYRMKFDVELPTAFKFPYLTLQMWDQDILKWNDCIASGQLHLGTHFRKCFKSKEQHHVFLSKKERALAKREKKATEKRSATAAKTTPVASSDREDKTVDDAAMRSSAVDRGVAAAVAAEVKANAKRKKARKDDDLLDDEDDEDEDDDDEEEEDVVPVAGGAGAPANAVAVNVDDDPAASAAVPSAKKEDGEEEDLMTAEQVAEKEGAQTTLSQVKKQLGIEELVKPDHAAWIPMYTEYVDGVMKREFAGEILLSVEILPKAIADSLPAGLGRSDPNANPFLPPPTGRMKFSFNPFYILSECLGAGLYRKVMFCVLMAIIIAGLIFGMPYINAVTTWLQIFPAPIGPILAGVLFSAVLCPPFYLYVRYVLCARNRGNADAKDDDDYALSPEERERKAEGGNEDDEALLLAEKKGTLRGGGGAAGGGGGGAAGGGGASGGLRRR